MRALVLGLAGALTITGFGAAALDEGTARPSAVPRFSGALTGGEAPRWLRVHKGVNILAIGPAVDAPAEAEVTIEKTIVPNNFTLELKAEENEAIIVQLLAGEIMIKSPPGEMEREGAGTWVIQPGEVQILRTEDDAAILRVTRLRR